LFTFIESAVVEIMNSASAAVRSFVKELSLITKRFGRQTKTRVYLAHQRH
jgi:hypothetical protein